MTLAALLCATGDARTAHAAAGLLERLRNVLPAAPVRALVQGPRNYLWVATSVGLSRYDGRRFVFVGQTEGLTGAVAALTLDPKGNVWAVGDGGALLQITGDHTRRISVDQLEVPHVLLAVPHEVWIGDDAGVVLVKLNENGTHTEARLKVSMPLPRVHALETDAQGVVWAGGDEGLWRIEGQSLNQVWVQPAV
ncbi:MAG: hypothetical protein SF187_21975, partial [Deltaproteobacteria bacterium]|nr:hypothetical protein [Deltaproteobacteria bacterium]